MVDMKLLLIIVALVFHISSTLACLSSSGRTNEDLTLPSIDKLQALHGPNDLASLRTIFYKINQIRPVNSFEHEVVRNRPPYGLQLVFFDGEEAFKKWSNDDSLYGSRHLAEAWYEDSYLKQIKLFILLDLLGASNPNIPRFSFTPDHPYDFMMQLETTLQTHNLLLNRKPNKPYFGRSTSAFIDDDHRPFLQKGVPILHLINFPFPSQWHTLEDNADGIDWDASVNLLRLIKSFVHTYLHLLV